MRLVQAKRLAHVDRVQKGAVVIIKNPPPLLCCSHLATRLSPVGLRSSSGRDLACPAPAPDSPHEYLLNEMCVNLKHGSFPNNPTRQTSLEPSFPHHRGAPRLDLGLGPSGPVGVCNPTKPSS